MVGKRQSMQMDTKAKQEQHIITNTLRQRLVRDKEGHCITTKGLIQQEEVTFVNTYASNIEATKYLK